MTKSPDGDDFRVDTDGLSMVARRFARDGHAFHREVQPLHTEAGNAHDTASNAWPSVQQHPLAGELIARHSEAMSVTSRFVSDAVTDFGSMARTTRTLLDHFGGVDGLNGADIAEIRRVANLDDREA